MFMPQLAKTGYGHQPVQVRTSRAVEYDLLARVTHQMRHADANPDRPESKTALVAALAENGRIWGAFALDVADKGNTLPQALRAQLFYLYEFTTQHTRKVLDGTASVGVLVEINTAVMRGLRGEAGASAA